MNADNDPLADEAIEGLLRPLRTVNPSGAVRSANRATIERILERHLNPPWWRRSVAVPMPLAIAASLALFITAAAALWPAFGHVVDAGPTVPALESAVDSDTPVPGWRITQSYILSLESLAQFQNSFRPESQEDRNES